MREVVEQARKVRYQTTIVDGRRFDIVATPLSNNDGTISKMLIIRDSTEQHQQEQRRLEISRQKEELKKLASLKNMAGAIAHRFNNAMESLEGGSGTIEISFGIDYFIKDDLPIFFQDTNLQDGMYAFCQIKDSGKGVSAEELPKVFEPFYSTKFFGRGLGLALSAGIMQTHHGALTFASSPDCGTTVRILLPSLESYGGEMRIAGDAKTPATQWTGTILLVDDEAFVLDVGRKILEKLGFSVDTAINGREALDKVRGRDSNYCAIVMDISMPGMDGIAAMKAIREVDSAIPIVLSSGYPEGDFIFDKDQENQPDGFLAKPFSIPELQSKLATILSPGRVGAEGE